jgi:Flp pilus assembly pilin Flp
LEDLTMNSSKLTKRLAGRRNQRGQGMTEYIIIVALIAIGAIGVYNLFGKSVRDQTTAMAYGLAGDKADSTTASALAKTDADNSKTEADTAQGLRNFGQNADNQ